MFLTPLELLQLLAALIPPPRIHRHRYAGVLAPNCPLRPQVIASAKVPAKPALDTLGTLEQVKQEIEAEMQIMRMSLRYSGTEPLFRVMLEAGYEHTEQELANAAHKICTTVQLAAGATEPALDSIEILNVSEGGLLHSQAKP